MMHGSGRGEERLPAWSEKHALMRARATEAMSPCDDVRELNSCQVPWRIGTMSRRVNVDPIHVGSALRQLRTCMHHPHLTHPLNLMEEMEWNRIESNGMPICPAPAPIAFLASTALAAASRSLAYPAPPKTTFTCTWIATTALAVLVLVHQSNWCAPFGLAIGDGDLSQKLRMVVAWWVDREPRSIWMHFTLLLFSCCFGVLLI